LKSDLLRVRYIECDAQKVVFNSQLVKQTIEWKAPARLDPVLDLSIETARLDRTWSGSDRDGRLLGSTGLLFEAQARAATGCVLARDAWRRGLATEALGAMVDLARKTGILRLYALCHHAHRASARVLQKGVYVLCYSRILE
jgi:RimJ/RimL family protein N-acetyltransferase